MNFTETAIIYSVTTLTRELKHLVEGKYRFVQVKGEISNLKRPFSGHSYFTLKDECAQLRGVLFKGQARYLSEKIKNGQQVICHGRISIYEPRGDYQLIVDTVDFQGSGLLQQQFEDLKRRLAEEGLFAGELKQELPLFPKKIILLTSPSGAAVHDFLKIWRNRNFPTDIKIFPVRVQGDQAAQEIATALGTVNSQLPDTDVVVLTGEEFEEFVLEFVGILILIDHDVAVAVGRLGAEGRIGIEDLICQHQQVVEIDEIVFDNVGLIRFVDLGNLFVVGQFRFFGHFLRGEQDIFVFADLVGHKRDIEVDFEVFGQGADEAFFVVAVDDDEGVGAAEAFDVEFEKEQTKLVEGRQQGRVGTLVADETNGAFAHLSGCFVGKSERQGIGRVDPHFADEVRQSGGEGLGLAAAGTGKD